MFWHHWFGIAALMGASAVGLGAFGAHALKGKLSPEHLSLFEIAVRYQIYHALALFAVAFASTRVDNFVLKLSGSFFVLGILLFCGSLHALIFISDSSRWAGPLTPIGGVFLILAWLILSFAAFC